MPSFVRLSAPLLGSLVLSAVVACSSSDDPGTGSGGTPGSAGSTTTAGTTGQGGAGSGAGGATGAAGSAGSATNGGAGNAGSGGVTGGAGTGGATGAAGSGGAAGGAGSGGATGAAGSGGAAGGSGGGGGSGGSGGSSGFAPCPATGACKILPLGDSITVGLGYDGGYRVELFRLAHSEGHDITFTGTQTPNGPAMVDGVTFPKQHAGISGQTIDQIAGRVPTPDLGGGANIILVHAGTNDMYGSAPATAHDRLGKMMDKLIKEAPDALLVFTSIIPLTFSGGQYADEVNTFNSHVEDMVNERAAKGSHIIYLDQFTGFPSSELGDMVHPNKAGYERMAGKFYTSIKSYLR